MSHLVLVPLDGSKFSESAVPTAIAIACRWNTCLEIVTVQEEPSMLADDLLELSSREWFERYVGDVAERVHEEACLAVTTKVLKGSSAEAIQDHAAARGVDLVVIATHGRGRTSRFWRGSTVDGLIRRSTIPILLLLPSGEGLGAQPDFDLRRVLVPLDGSLESEAILTHAVAWAGHAEAEFDVLRVYPRQGTYASSHLSHNAQVSEDELERGRTEAVEYVEEGAAWLIEQGMSATGHVVAGTTPATAILEFAERSGADLIAMSTHGRGGLSRFVLGSVTDEVIRGTQIPTLIYHPHESSEQV